MAEGDGRQTEITGSRAWGGSAPVDVHSIVVDAIEVSANRDIRRAGAGVGD